MNVAFYLPQFHPLPVNDEFWGKGFTEWTNVAKAVPLFHKHQQPRFPAELGYYDLRVSEVQELQSNLALTHGVDAFCYWHYWFDGKPLMNRPVESMLTNSAIKINFMFGWANQSWTGTWHGLDKKVMLTQDYGRSYDIKQHFNYMLPFFKDSRYVKVDKKPVLYIFRPSEIPDIRLFTSTWNNYAKAEGFNGMFFIAERSRLLPYFQPDNHNYLSTGFDLVVRTELPAYIDFKAKLSNRLRKLLRGGPTVFKYATIGQMSELAELPSKEIRAVYPNWDHSPRSGRRAIVLIDDDPQVFAQHLAQAIDISNERNIPNEFVFIKSWNEWAEGNYLEPDRLNGKAYLEAVAQCLRR